MLDISKASLKQLIGLALRSEIDSNKVYSRLAARVSNPLLKEKFEWLAYEENKHKKILEKLSGTLFKGERVKIPEKTDKALLPSVNIVPSSSLADILYQAMESEKSAENFYALFSRRVDNPQKKMLVYLSKVEHSHYRMLESEYAMALEFEDYAEKDIDKVIT